MKQQDSISTPPLDALTVGSIGILAYMLGNVLHEALGHGGACLLVGARPLVLSSVHFECSSDTRLVFAGGTLINLLAGIVFFALGRLTGPSYPRWKYFFWIAMTVNLYTGTGYFLFSGIGGIGDWAAFTQTLGHEWVWRIALRILGGVTYLLTARISLLELRPLIGSEKEERYQRAQRLALIPYFAGGTLMCIAGTLKSQRNDFGFDLSCGIDLRWHFGTSVGHWLAQPRNANSLWTNSRSNAHSQEQTFGVGGLRGRDCFLRPIGPECPIGTLRVSRCDRPRPASGMHRGLI